MFAAPLRLAKKPPSTTPGQAEGIDQLAFLIGGTWVGELTRDGKTSTLEETCTWTDQQQAIETAVVMKEDGQVMGTVRGGFGWCDREEKLLTFAFSDSGQAEFGEQDFQDGSSWGFKVHSVAESVCETQVVMKRQGDDELIITADQGSPDEVNVVYRRRPTVGAG